MDDQLQVSSMAYMVHISHRQIASLNNIYKIAEIMQYFFFILFEILEEISIEMEKHDDM